MKPNEFIKKYGNAAIMGTKDSTLLPSVSLAQAILESGWGESDLAKDHNNFYGIKPGYNWKGETVAKPTREYINDHWTTIYPPDPRAVFRSYKNPSQGFTDRVKFLQKRSYYDKVFEETTPEGQAWALQNAKYATDPKYAEKLISIISTYKLTELDKKKRKYEKFRIYDLVAFLYNRHFKNRSVRKIL